MGTSDFATLVSLASEADQEAPSKLLLNELTNNVSDENRALAEALSGKSKHGLSQEQIEYLSIIKTLAESN